jgi:hypothetical protein
MNKENPVENELNENVMQNNPAPCEKPTSNIFEVQTESGKQKGII